MQRSIARLLTSSFCALRWSTESRGETVRIPVAIIREEKRKPYLGGFRNKKTGLVYHHASSQTTFERANKWDNMAERFTRETQTVDTVTRSQQTVRETATQMKRHDLYIDESKDRVIEPKDYFNADKLHRLREEKTLFLQCQWRGYCARKLAWQLREEAADKADAMYREEERKRAEVCVKSMSNSRVSRFKRGGIGARTCQACSSLGVCRTCAGRCQAQRRNPTQDAPTHTRGL